MRLLFLGDIFGKPGRVAVREWLPEFKAERSVDFVIANAENSAGGKGVTRQVAHELFKHGTDVLTGGNHSFQHRESYSFFDQEPRLLRPANLPPGAPGRSWGVFEAPGGLKVGVLNLQGRAFMRPIDCPFRTADVLLKEILAITPLVVVDFHAEATSEKIGMAAWLDGKVTAVIGTHTHIPTADARVSAAGTAAITDAGMTGVYDSIIGIETQIVLDQMITGMPVHHHVAEGSARICGVLIDCDANGRATAIEQIFYPEWKRTA